MKPPLWVAEAGIWKDSFPLVVFVMVVHVVDIDTPGSHPSNLSGALLFFLERRRHDTPEKKLTLTKLANYRNFAFKDFTVPTGRNKKIFRSQHGFLFPLIRSPFIYTGVLIFDPNHDMCKEPRGYQTWN
jgi:hypothetical protein